MAAAMAVAGYFFLQFRHLVADFAMRKSLIYAQNADFAAIAAIAKGIFYLQF